MITLEDARAIYELPITTLLFRAQQAHQRHQDPSGVQLGTLKSIKTGACPEDCAYCPQSSRNKTFVEAEALMETEAIVADARRAVAGGASRFCMGAAWRRVNDGPQFESVLATVRGVKALGLEVCCTLGMLSGAQARRLKEAGCDVYNHNIDTSREFYSRIITTRTYDDRLDTLRAVRSAGMEVCSGGILGMGESVDDRLKMLVELARMEPQPESVPINALVAVEGTPLAGRAFVDAIEFVRVIATARILMPRAMVRLSAGRSHMSLELQTLCFAAGANSIFFGEKLLTTGNNDAEEDFAMLARLGLHPVTPAEARVFHSAGDGHEDCGLPEFSENGTWGRACAGAHAHA
jgi:biotin synthase